ncbi:MAG TPA: hypothetical protein VJ875_21830, partial [Pyrinomonadaceae bacterium]|nr:hypothetical protein [Pyrinomonadaceae bacterium]
MKNLNKLTSWIALGGMLFACSAPDVHPQRAERPPRIWETRARNITDILLADLPQLEKNDKAMLLARLGQIWSKRDPQRARKWFTLAVETLETAPADKREVACQRATAVVLLGIISGHNKALADRLAAIIEAPKKGQNDSERLENANALIEAGMAVLTPDPHAAERFGEDSLNLGFSYRLGSLLMHLYISNPTEGDKLFSQILTVAKSKSDYNLFGVLVNQVLNGPFTANKYKRSLLGTLADAIPEIERSGNSAAFCNPVPLLEPLLADFDRLLPEFSQQVRGHIQRCQQLRPDPPKPSREIRTIEDLLRAGHDADNPTD